MKKELLTTALILIVGMGALFAQTISLTSPSGGEQYKVGDNVDITFTFTGITTIIIEFSSNSGSTWQTLTSSATSSPYNWTVPNTISSQCVIRVSDASNLGVNSKGGTFLIEDVTGFLNYETDAKIYTSPNPCNDKTYLYYPENLGTNLSYVLYSANGFLLESKKISLQGDKIEIDLSDNADGLYFITIQDGANSITRKIIKGSN